MCWKKLVKTTVFISSWWENLDTYLEQFVRILIWNYFISVLKSLCKKGASYRIMSYEAYKQQLQWNTKMVYRRAYSNDTTSGRDNTQAGKHERQLSQEQRKVSNHTVVTVETPMAGKHERQGSQEEKTTTVVTPGKLKRPLSQENGEPQTKKLKVSDEV